MAEPRIGPDLAVFRLGWRRSTSRSGQITADIHEHVVGLLHAAERGESFRAGNVLVVHVLGTDEQDPRLLLVSTDIGWTRHNQDAVDALEAHATVQDEGRFTVVPEASASLARDDGDVPARDLGHRVLSSSCIRQPDVACRTWSRRSWPTSCRWSVLRPPAPATSSTSPCSPISAATATS